MECQANNVSKHLMNKSPQEVPSHRSQEITHGHAIDDSHRLMDDPPTRVPLPNYPHLHHNALQMAFISRATPTEVVT